MSVGGLTVRTCCDQQQGEGANPVPTLQVRDVEFSSIDKATAIEFNRLHHSRLPQIANIGLSHAFAATHNGVILAVALWSKPVARLLPQSWLELRRMACSDEMPNGGASAFLAWMTRRLMRELPDCDRFISYQDAEVHLGTIYKAAGWTIGNISKSTSRAGWASRPRPLLNGSEPIKSGKVRWEKHRR